MENAPQPQGAAGAYAALVVGAQGGIGAALADALSRDPDCATVTGLSRLDGLDITDESTVAKAASRLADRSFDRILVATGALTIDGHGPEKTIHRLDPEAMARQFAVNAIGPALVLKHFAPMLPKDRRSVFAILSARVGSIGDNRLGGWISYRASKAALNQIVRTAAIEIARTRPQALIVALHPGTVATRLSDPFTGDRPRVSPEAAAADLLAVIGALPASATGGFFAYDGQPIAW